MSVYRASAIPASAFLAVLPVDLSAWDDLGFSGAHGRWPGCCVRCGFQGLAKADVELGRVICAPPRVHGPMDPFERCEFDNIISSMPWAFMLDDFGFAGAIFRPGHCIVAAVSDAAR